MPTKLTCEEIVYIPKYNSFFYLLSDKTIWMQNDPIPISIITKLLLRFEKDGYTQIRYETIPEEILKQANKMLISKIKEMK